jgi:hypothetical protein
MRQTKACQKDREQLLTLDETRPRGNLVTEIPVMKKLFLVLLFAIFVSSATFAQKIGEKLPDERGALFPFETGHKANVRIGDHKLQIVFLDENNLVEEAPYKRAVVRIDRLQAGGDDLNLVLRAEDSIPYLSHPRFIEPPLTFRIHVIFYANDQGDEGKVSFPMTYFRWENAASQEP